MSRPRTGAGAGLRASHESMIRSNGVHRRSNLPFAFVSRLLRMSASRSSNAQRVALEPWWRAARSVVRRARAGVWQRLPDFLRERRIPLEMVCLGDTRVRAHQKAGGAARKGDPKPSGLLVTHLATLVAGLA